jgi:hypothetical protein
MLKEPPLRLEPGVPLRRIEDKIRARCGQLLAEQDEAKLTPLIVELRDELHRYIEQLRAKLVDYPVTIERRKSFSR